MACGDGAVPTGELDALDRVGDAPSDVPETGAQGEGASTGSFPCPAGMLAVAGGTFELGESDSDWLIPTPDDSWEDLYPGLDLLGKTTIYLSSFVIADFCMDRFPFPGVEGAAWPADGLNLDTMDELELQLAEHGRRPCAITELLLAAAGPDNWRFPYDEDERLAGVCEPDDDHPGPIGRLEGCESPLGFRDFSVRSTWGRLDDQVLDVLAPYDGPIHPPWDGAGQADEEPFAVYGGTTRSGSFYNATNFGIHSHPRSIELYLDDGFRLCTDPGQPSAGLETTWQDRLSDFFAVGTYQSWLGLE